MSPALAIVLTLWIAFFCTHSEGGYCYQIPANCGGCPSGGSFLQCTSDPSDTYCYRKVSFVVLGRMHSHPADTSDNLLHANPGQIGQFIIDDVIINNMPLTQAPKPGDTLQTAWGGSCFSWHKPDSLQAVIAFTFGGTQYDSTSCYYIPGCGTFMLRYEYGTVKGAIASGISEMEYGAFKEIIQEKTGALPRPIMSTNKKITKLFVQQKGQNLIIAVPAGNVRKRVLSIHSLDGRVVGRYVLDIYTGSVISVDLGNRCKTGVIVISVEGFLPVVLTR